MEVQEIMTTNVTTTHPDQVVGELHKLFIKVRYHHLPVVEAEKLIGLVSDRDISHNLSPYVGTNQQRPEDEKLLQRSVADIMTWPLICVNRTTSIDTASILLLENNISCLPIVDEEYSLEGLLTWRDILRFHVYYAGAGEEAAETG